MKCPRCGNPDLYADIQGDSWSWFNSIEANELVFFCYACDSSFICTITGISELKLRSKP